MVQFNNEADILQAIQDVFVTAKDTPGSIIRDEYVPLFLDRLSETIWNTFGSSLIDPTRQAISLGAATNVIEGGDPADLVANSVCIQFLIDAGYSLQFPLGIFSFENINMDNVEGRIIAGSGQGTNADGGSTVFRAYTTTRRMFYTTDALGAENIELRDFNFDTDPGAIPGCALWVTGGDDGGSPDSFPRDLQTSFNRIKFTRCLIPPVFLEGNLFVYFNSCNWEDCEDACFVSAEFKMDYDFNQGGGTIDWGTLRAAVQILAMRDCFITGSTGVLRDHAIDFSGSYNNILVDNVVFRDMDAKCLYKNGGHGLTVRNCNIDSCGAGFVSSNLFELLNVDGCRFVDNDIFNQNDNAVTSILQAVGSTLWCRGNTMQLTRNALTKQFFVTSDGTTGLNTITIRESVVEVTAGDVDDVSDILSTEVSGGAAAVIDLVGTTAIGANPV